MLIPAIKPNSPDKSGEQDDAGCCLLFANQASWLQTHPLPGIPPGQR